jgi:geranylgeranyl diphosphate synthase, type II
MTLRALFEERLRARLEATRDRAGEVPPPRLLEAMAYTLFAGGKRLRPLLVLQSALAAASEGDEARAVQLALPAAFAVEYVHTYSLIHDDLPALDDDALRRGRPTLHVAFDEATAILAGDGLLTDAFAFTAGAERRGAEQCLELALAAGSAGMVGGQWDDVQAEGKPIDGEGLLAIHRRKTGRLFVASCVLGGLSVDADEDTLDKLRRYGAAFGLAFQIVDDVLDVSGREEERGKKAGGDAALEKATYVRAYGLEEARRRGRELAEHAAVIAGSLGEKAGALVELARLAAERAR